MNMSSGVKCLWRRNCFRHRNGQNGGGVVSETKTTENDGNKEEEKDWFLEAFLVGYRKEKDRRQRLNSVKEEREKKAMDRKKTEEEWRREERSKFENKMMGELIRMKKTLVTVREEGKKLRLKIEELRKEVKEERLVKVIAEKINRVGKVKEANGHKARISEMKEELEVKENRENNEGENDEVDDEENDEVNNEEET